MKKIFIAAALLLSCFIRSNAQNAAETPTKPADGPKTEAPVSTVEPDKKENEKTTNSLPSGYAETAWNEEYKTVKDKIKGKIVYSDEDRIIISKENGLTYKYGFFYIDPEKVKDMPNAGNPARLFYCVIEFPYIALDEVKNKVKEKYGEPVGENVKRNKGAVYWDSEKTSVVIWVDEYEKKPYSRKIIYFSKDIINELKDYKFRLFNQKELEVIKNFLP
ncbi:MAG TPA: hypothetical protein PK624_05810 [Spirochaetota bacterium]|nr:hypothetical protein [Spirochaetota bacterium]HOR44293.1 hypothetical protein [Spirochaetota bacterium]HOU84943.1 hypothetical protein [Spirochaetota bacterium]HPK55773.1 hypothetical protein [Spirochaetota bacterium]HQE57807.1 hypothetical protein [Spirochaetota bacterium]